MAVTPSSEVPFHEDDLSPAIDAVTAIERAGSGWVNLVPEVAEGEEPPPRSLLAWFFSNRGDAVPMITWSPASRPGGRATVGLAHGSGPRGLVRLSEEGLERPDGWFKVTDHARRGIVLTVPAASDRADAVHWLLTAAHVLCSVPLTGHWLARSYVG